MVMEIIPCHVAWLQEMDRLIYPLICKGQLFDLDLSGSASGSASTSASGSPSGFRTPAMLSLLNIYS